MRVVFGSAVLAVAVVGVVLAVNPNERAVKPGRNVQDTDDIGSADNKVWVLDFKFKDPRLIKVDIPGRGQRVCWYLWYQVINYTKEPRTLIPDFELLAFDKDLKPTVYHDQVLPKVEDAIRKIEDPTGYFDIKNSVTIAANPIPVSKQDAVPRAVTGVAIWDGVDPNANRFSIIVSGLSNGWALTDPIPPETQPVVRRKTLRLNFRRLGDGTLNRAQDIKFVPPEEWIYHGSKLTVPGLPGVPREGAPKEPAPKEDADKTGAFRTTPNPYNRVSQ
jgi:hypothetical protein